MVESATLKKDLQLAHRIQQSFLPSERPKLPEYEFYDYYKPANDVGGDYFDYIQVDDKKLAIVIADVVGHGVAAALLMAKLAAETEVAIKTEDSLSQAMQHLNRQSHRIPDDQFVTMVIALLDTETHQLQVINAGHAQPLIRRADGSIFQPDEDWSDVPIGILDETEFPEYQIDLHPGDMVLLFTDGLNESINEAEEEYSIDRVIQQLAAAKNSDPVMIAGEIISDMKKFIGQTSPFDDICVVAFGRAENHVPDQVSQDSPS
jgi:sigma-B regulation protein RsbU (phosphoserine phosphatase)